MKKLKKVIPIIIAFIIGISTTVGAATVFNSKDIVYSSDKTTKTNVKDSLDELYSKVGKCPEGQYCFGKAMPLDIVEIGDYISMTPTSTNYTISKDLTGYSADQIINPSELNLWRVIRKNEDGTVDVVSEYVSNERIFFSDKTGYINYIGTLNTIAAQYTNSKFVKKTKHLGYSNQTEFITNTSKVNQTTPPWDKNTWTHTLYPNCDSSVLTCGKYETEGGGDFGFKEDLELIKSVLGTYGGKNSSGTRVDELFASRLYGVYPNGSSINGLIPGSPAHVYSVGIVRASGVNDGLETMWLYAYQNGIKTWSLGGCVRPILTLKGNIEIKSGNGESSEIAFELK